MHILISLKISQNFPYYLPSKNVSRLLQNFCQLEKCKILNKKKIVFCQNVINDACSGIDSRWLIGKNVETGCPITFITKYIIFYCFVFKMSKLNWNAFVWEVNAQSIWNEEKPTWTICDITNLFINWMIFVLPIHTGKIIQRFLKQDLFFLLLVHI